MRIPGCCRVTPFRSIQSTIWPEYSQVLSVRVEPCEPKVAALLRLDEQTQVISINRLRLADGEPMAVENVFIPFHLCPGLVQRDLSGSLYRMLDEYGLRVAHAQQNIAAGFSPHAICELLKIKPNVPTLQIERVTYLEDGQPLECVFSAYRSDRYTFHVDMSR